MRTPELSFTRVCLAAMTYWITLCGWSHAQAADSTVVKKLFADPPREYATAPLWVWNDLLSESQIRETMRDLAGQRVKQVFVHPRPGLMTPYLSDDWFRLWKVALDEAAKLDMNVWIYDENSYPSGFAGGWVPELMPASRGMGLSLRETKTAAPWTEATVGVYRLDPDKAEPIENVTGKAKAGDSLAEGRYLAATLQRAGNSPWHGNRCYVNLLTPGVTEKFIEVTLEPYRKHLGEHFGKRIPGVFTDEPNIRPAGGFPWCEDLPERFQQRWGYNLLDHLPSLSLELGDWRRVRHNYFCLLNELYIERWGKPYYAWCEKNGLEFTGHYWDHEWPHCIGVPDNMAMAAWQHRPGIDTLMNQYAENTHAQFGNVRFCREISSIANQLGRKRTLVELYGAGGWDLRFEDMKRIGDWLEVLGINTLDEHLSYITLRGARKRDHPQSFSYHEPWWEAYHVSASYLTRLSAALSQGEQVNKVLVLEPTTTAWMYQGNEPRLKEIGDAFFDLLMALERAQVEYDLGCEDVIARHGAVNGPELKVGQRSYSMVVVPPLTENLNAATDKLLSAFVQAGGRQVALEAPIHRVDGKATAATASSASPEPGLRARLPEMIRQQIRPLLPWTGISLDQQTGDRGILFHQRRELGDGQVLFLVNSSLESPASGSLSSTLRGIEQWDPYSGAVTAYPFEVNERSIAASFKLPPSGSLLLFFSKKPLKPAPTAEEQVTSLPATGPVEIQRPEPNVLTLDFVDVTAGGETRTNMYFYAANQFAWQKNGMERNPWDSAVQFKDELIRKSFPADSGFAADYRFTIEGAVPANLAIVIERPDLYTIACNGQPLKAKKGAWWLDKAFGRIGLAAVARVGENVVTLQAAPFTIYHELEPAYVLGEFTLKPVDHGFAIAADQPLELSDQRGWNQQGHPFYSAGVAYRQTFNVDRKADRYLLALPKWYGSAARVRVNGDLAGYITAPPWEMDLTRDLIAGDNTIEVTVIGTLKNTLGPHHGKPPLGSAWPGMFQQGPKEGLPPGNQYHTVSYGLFEPFTLKQVTRK